VEDDEIEERRANNFMAGLFGNRMPSLRFGGIHGSLFSGLQMKGSPTFLSKDDDFLLPESSINFNDNIRSKYGNR